MKQPRISDFDPYPKERILKSSMDEFPMIEQPARAQPKMGTSEQRTSVLADQGTGVPPEPSTGTKRKIKKRHPFDIYEDQIEALKKRSIEEQMQGGIGSQSAMVREALDAYLAKINPNWTRPIA